MANVVDRSLAGSAGYKLVSQQPNSLTFKLPVNGPKFICASRPQTEGVHNWRFKVTGNTRCLVVVVSDCDCRNGEAVKTPGRTVGRKNTSTHTGDHEVLDMAREWVEVVCDMNQKLLRFYVGGIVTDVPITVPPPVRLAFAGFNGTVVEFSTQGPHPPPIHPVVMFAPTQPSGTLPQPAALFNLDSATHMGYRVTHSEPGMFTARCERNGPQFLATPPIGSGSVHFRYLLSANNKNCLVVAIRSQDASKPEVVKSSGKTVGYKNSTTNTGSHDRLNMVGWVDVVMDASARTITFNVDGNTHSKQITLSGTLCLAFTGFNGTEFRFDLTGAGSDTPTQHTPTQHTPTQHTPTQHPAPATLISSPPPHSDMFDFQSAHERGCQMTDTDALLVVKWTQNGPISLASPMLNDGIFHRRYKLTAQNKNCLVVAVREVDALNHDAVKMYNRTIGFKNSSTNTGTHDRLAMNDKWVDVVLNVCRRSLSFIIDGTPHTKQIPFDPPMRLTFVGFNGTEFSFDKLATLPSIPLPLPQPRTMPAETTLPAEELFDVGTAQQCGYTFRTTPSHGIYKCNRNGPLFLLCPPASAGIVRRRFRLTSSNRNCLVVAISERDRGNPDSVKTSGRTAGFKNTATQTGDHERVPMNDEWVDVELNLDQRAITITVAGTHYTKPVFLGFPVRLAFVGFNGTEFTVERMGSAARAEPGGLPASSLFEEAMARNLGYTIHTVSDVITARCARNGPQFLLTPRLSQGVRRYKLTASNKNCLVVAVPEMYHADSNSVKITGRTVGYKNSGTQTGDHERVPMNGHWVDVVLDCDRRTLTLFIMGQAHTKQLNFSGPARIAFAGFNGTEFNFDKTAGSPIVSSEIIDIAASPYTLISTEAELTLKCTENGPKLLLTEAVDSGVLHRRYRLSSSNTNCLVVAIRDSDHMNHDAVKTRGMTIGFKNSATNTGNHDRLAMTSWVDVSCDVGQRSLVFVANGVTHTKHIPFNPPMRLAFVGFNGTAFTFDRSVQAPSPLAGLLAPRPVAPQQGIISMPVEDKGPPPLLHKVVATFRELGVSRDTILDAVITEWTNGVPLARMIADPNLILDVILTPKVATPRVSQVLAPPPTAQSDFRNFLQGMLADGTVFPVELQRINDFRESLGLSENAIEETGLASQLIEAVQKGRTLQVPQSEPVVQSLPDTAPMPMAPILSSSSITPSAPSLEEIESGSESESGGTDRIALYVAYLRGLISDGKVDETEKENLLGYRCELGITIDEHAAALRVLGMSEVEFRTHYMSPLEEEQSEPAPSPDPLCVVCIEARIESVVVPCGHYCMCYECASNVATTGRQASRICPICRVPVREVCRIYES